ncbi:MAG: 1,4-beta-xylanase [Microthrixaceae bacterium]
MPTRIDLYAHLLRHGLDIAKGAYPARWTAPLPSEARWSREQANAWQDRTGWLVGCNFMPSTAGNQLEMFQADTYDPATIDRELGWAAELGMNSIRLFLHHLLPEVPGFWDRLDEVLDLAAGRGIGAMPVLLDGCWNPVARLGPQPGPRPGTHNSMWLQSPGAAILSDPRRWEELRPYVDEVLTRFGDDPRVQCWDLFNEPNGPEIAYPRTGCADKYRLATGLLDRVVDWAQEADPSQPLTAGVFVGVSGALERGDPINRIMLTRSDVITFHSYLPRGRLAASIDHLTAYGRPLLCTEWLGRPRSTVELIEVFRDRGVGCHTWGLVDGRTQTKYPWTSWNRPTPDDAPWFHELFHPDGTPYDPAETELFARVVRERPGGTATD